MTEYTETDLVPEIGDTVQFGSPSYDKYGNCTADAPRDVIRKVFRNGTIVVGERRSAIKLKQGEYIILSKAG